ncbi:MAG: M48 family metallopeptidase [Bacteroidaceae bacterium]|nr:M48 family metallopeptidase [Bacteroidaceae bacterium]
MMIPENCTVIHREVKHARLRVHEDGSVRLFVPNSFTNEQIEKVLEMKAEWIASKQKFFKQKGKILLSRNEILLFGNRYSYFCSSQYQHKVVINHDSKTIQAKRDLLNMEIQEKWLKGVAGTYIRKRVNELSEKLLLPYHQLYVRNQKSKWGNCSVKKNISINWRIIKAPPFVIDYIITHELCHTVIMKHSVKFQTLLQSHCPCYEQAQKWLEKYGNSL